MPLEPFKPAFGGKILPVGCSDKDSRSRHGINSSPHGPKLTTYTRTTAAIEQYWQDRAANVAAVATHPAPASSPTKPDAKGNVKIPGGELAQAYKTREACWKDSVQLGHQPDRYIPTCSGVPADIEEKEVARTRGIPGFTGKQPAPGLSRPPPPATDTSSWVAINAFDERRPRVKGIPGYTGHQPPSPDRRQQAAAAGDASRHDQMYDHSTHSWLQSQQPITASTATGPLHHSSQQQQGRICSEQSAAPAQSHQEAYIRAAAATAVEHNSNRPYTNSTAQTWSHTAGQLRPWSGSAVTGAPSTPYSPRYFMNGDQIPSQTVPLPASATSTCCSSVGVLNERQDRGEGHHTPQTGLGEGEGSDSCRCRCHLQEQQCKEAVLAHHTNSNVTLTPCRAVGQDAAVGGSAVMQRPTSAFSGLPRNRQTTYAAAYTPSAGFGVLLQK